MILVFSLDGCPACKELKKALDKNEYKYVDLEITKYPRIWESIVNITNSDSVPTLYIKQTNILNENDEEKDGEIYVAGEDFDNTEELITLLKNYFTNKGE